MHIDMDGTVALVTGASRGIGAAIAQQLAASGAAVVLSSRKQDALDEQVARIAEAVPGSEERLVAIAANAGDPDDAARCVAGAVERFGRLDVLVNNAATSPYMGPTIDIDLARHDKTIEVNQRGPLVWTQEAWRASMRDNGGAVLNIASIGGLSVETSIGIYNETKAALLYQTKLLAAELAPSVRVNAIAPGLVKTDMARALWEQHEDAIARREPLQRLGEPDDIAQAATFLCSDAASWITGATLVVDGGMVLRA